MIEIIQFFNHPFFIIVGGIVTKFINRFPKNRKIKEFFCFLLMVYML
jgi:hypothetical protein